MECCDNTIMYLYTSLSLAIHIHLQSVLPPLFIRKAHVSYDIASSFLEGSLGMRNISFVNNTFRSVSGCGATRSGAHGCDHLCTNISCVLSHIDPALAGEVHASGNRVFAQSSVSAPARGPAPLPAPSTPAVAAIPGRRFPSPTQLQVREGTLRGMTNDHGKLHLFKGIPFATPPLGALRWHPPTPRAPWTGVREAIDDSKSCYQGSNIWDKLSNYSEGMLLHISVYGLFDLNQIT